VADQVICSPLYRKVKGLAFRQRHNGHKLG
jgi:hypothetical protein